MRQFHQRGDIQPDAAQLFVYGQLQEFSAAAKTGIVDEGFHDQSALVYSAAKLGHSSARGQIQRDGFNADSERVGQLVSELIELILCSCNEDEIRGTRG